MGAAVLVPPAVVLPTTPLTLPPQTFGIASSESTPSGQPGGNGAATESGVEDMCVVGQCLGDKRKQEHLQTAKRASLSPPTGLQSAETEVDAEGQKATSIPMQPESPQKTDSKRSDMLDDLKGQVASEAAAAQQRSSPYGHG